MTKSIENSPSIEEHSFSSWRNAENNDRLAQLDNLYVLYRDPNINDTKFSQALLEFYLGPDWSYGDAENNIEYLFNFLDSKGVNGFDDVTKRQIFSSLAKGESVNSLVQKLGMSWYILNKNKETIFRDLLNNAKNLVLFKEDKK